MECDLNPLNTKKGTLEVYNAGTIFVCTETNITTITTQKGMLLYVYLLDYIREMTGLLFRAGAGRMALQIHVMEA